MGEGKTVYTIDLIRFREESLEFVFGDTNMNLREWDKCIEGLKQFYYCTPKEAMTMVLTKPLEPVYVLAEWTIDPYRIIMRDTRSWTQLPEQFYIMEEE